jgi:bacteriocin-like protein
MTATIKITAPSKQVRQPVREPTRELTEDELAHVSGGIIAILIGKTGARTPTDPC